MSKLEGSWNLVDGDFKNFDEYMKACGVGYVTRKAGTTIKPSQHISTAGDGNWTIKTTSTFKNTELNFTIGQEFDETTADGRKVKTTASMDGEKLVQSQKGDVDSTMIRELVDDDTMKMTITAKDITCVRTYKRA